ncbi:MAG: 2-oxoglutarate dehydrogenase E1 component [Syntrophobacteraceae bacterium]|nr:2-oxoglutarate dehydrogenase E1 component [Syntrophobacteraceae bacterium]
MSLQADFIESEYLKWKSNPESVAREWRIFFDGFDLAARFGVAGPGVCDRNEILRQCGVQELIYRYRDLGHILTCLDPLGRCEEEHALLALSDFGLSEEDLDRSFHTPSTLFAREAPLKQIVEALKATYCSSLGVEYMHLQDPGERLWLQERMEPGRNRPVLSRDEQLLILNKLCQATLFEHFLHTRYVGQKRFSLEGAEVIIAMLHFLLGYAGQAGCREVLVGMAHRGRLNIQVNVLGKLYEHLFCEFEEHYDPHSLFGSGDVKYHRGYMVDDLDVGQGRRIRVLIPSNPSHLEAVNPVLEGLAHARREKLGEDGPGLVLPVLIHGDAAFAGQGVVAETLNLSQLEGYSNGGTLHLVINNQIGFTTLPEHARSTRYATDMAKMLLAPIFHVHGEDPEAAVHAVKLALDYRAKFAKDVVIDLVCFRRYGHNEGDEPYYTQPGMYARIKDRPPLYKIYFTSLKDAGLASGEDLDRITSGINECMELAYKRVHDKLCQMPEETYYDVWRGLDGKYSHEPVETGVGSEKLLELAGKLLTFPQGFTVHPRLQRILARRLQSVKKGKDIDWANAETLAFASLVTEGVPVRLSGQDSGRGTFSQRHSVLFDVNTEERYVPLSNLSAGQAKFMVYDSALSEGAVLAFEYGYSLTTPETLTIWEAQFGDFANNAQSVFDQFISGGESKWRRPSGLTILLPHGLEGQGPEHSSARFERHLQLCAEDNMQVCYPSTPAQYFHLLRRQMRRNFRKPLIVLTPKSLLRLPEAVSTLGELSSGHFREILEDPGYEKARKIYFCSGKIYYELVEKRKAAGATDTAILRVEQFYPFAEEALKSTLAKYPSASLFYWVQEEPENMGAWNFIESRLKKVTGRDIAYIGRAPAASPASGYLATYRQEQDMLMEMAFATP